MPIFLWWFVLWEIFDSFWNLFGIFFWGGWLKEESNKAEILSQKVSLFVVSLLVSSVTDTHFITVLLFFQDVPESRPQRETDLPFFSLTNGNFGRGQRCMLEEVNAENVSTRLISRIHTTQTHNMHIRRVYGLLFWGKACRGGQWEKVRASLVYSYWSINILFVWGSVWQDVIVYCYLSFCNNNNAHRQRSTDINTMRKDLKLTKSCTRYSDMAALSLQWKSCPKWPKSFYCMCISHSLRLYQGVWTWFLHLHFAVRRVSVSQPARLFSSGQSSVNSNNVRINNCIYLCLHLTL